MKGLILILALCLLGCALSRGRTCKAECAVECDCEEEASMVTEGTR